MVYKIRDNQFNHKYFADGKIFRTKRTIREQLIDYHLDDCLNPEILKKMTLNEILEYGNWSLEALHDYRFTLKLKAVVKIIAPDKDDAMDTFIAENLSEILEQDMFPYISIEEVK